MTRSIVGLNLLLLAGKLLLPSMFLLGGQSLMAEAQSVPSLCAENCSMQLAQAQPMSPANATVEPGSYTNHFFGFTLQFPESWAIANYATTEAIQDVEAPLMRPYGLLSISPYPIDAPMEAPEEWNFSSFIISATPVSAFPNLQTGEDYISYFQQVLRDQLPFIIQRDSYPVTLGGRVFHRLDTTFDITFDAYNISAQQSYLATVDSGFVLIFALSGLEQDMGELNAIVQSIQF